MQLADEFDMYYNQLVNNDDAIEHDNHDMCKDCNVEYIRDDVHYICPSCGICHPIMYEDAENDSRSLASNKSRYKHMNHLSEILNQLQGRQMFIQKDVVVADVKKLLENQPVTYDNVKWALRKLKYGAHYGHIYLIINELDNTQRPPSISRNREEKIKKIFKQVLIRYHQLKKTEPTLRKSFLNYNFVLHHICQMLGYNDLLCYFPLIKTKRKLIEQSAIWNKLMDC